MGHLNLLLTCIVTVMTGYLGTYSAYVEPSGLVLQQHLVIPEAASVMRFTGVSLAAASPA
jgi:hypothetical protein